MAGKTVFAWWNPNEPQPSSTPLGPPQHSPSSSSPPNAPSPKPPNPSEPPNNPPALPNNLPEPPNNPPEPPNNPPEPPNNPQKPPNNPSEPQKNPPEPPNNPPEPPATSPPAEPTAIPSTTSSEEPVSESSSLVEMVDPSNPNPKPVDQPQRVQNNRLPRGINIGPSFSLSLPPLKPPLSIYLPSGPPDPPQFRPPATVIVQVAPFGSPNNP